MKRLSKLIAVLAALIMVFAMSSSVFAANYSAGDLANGAEIWEDSTQWDDEYVWSEWLDDMDPEEAILLNPDKIKDILDDKYDIPADAEIIPIYGADVKYGVDIYDDQGNWIGDKEVAIKDKVGIDFVLADKDLKAGDVVYLLHYNESTKVWEIYEKTVQTGTDQDGNTVIYVSHDFTSLSPVGIVKVMQNGTTVVNLVEKKSPDTGL